MFPIDWQDRERGRIVLFSAEAIETMLSHRQVALASTEAGGVLAGYRKGPHLQVIAVSTPGRTDGRSRTRFERRDRKHKKFIHDQWKTSGGTVDYLGEWHTHPERVPYPSGLDFSQARDISKSFPRSPILEVVVGLEGVWVGAVSPSSIEPFEPSPNIEPSAGHSIITPESVGAPDANAPSNSTGRRLLHMLWGFSKTSKQ